MLVGCAVIDLGGAEPIRFDVAKVVLGILAIKWCRREISDVLSCCFALIGQSNNPNSGFCSSLSCGSDEPPTSWISMNRLGFVMKRICCAVIS